MLRLGVVFDFIQLRLKTDQPYDEAFEVGDEEEVASLASETPSPQHRHPHRGGVRGSAHAQQT